MIWWWAISLVVWVWTLAVGWVKWSEEGRSKTMLAISFISAISMLVAAVLM